MKRVMLLAALLAALALALPAQAPSAAGQAGLTSLKLAVPGPAVAAGPVYLARDRGYFAAQGLDVELVTFSTSAEMVPALATGEALVGIGAASPGTYNAIRRGIELKIVADAGSTRPGAGFTALVVRKDLVDGGQVRDFADLRGRRIAVPSRASTSLIDVDRAVQQGGLTLDDVEIVELPFVDMNAAFASRNLDAAIQIEPFVAVGAARDLFVRWKGSDELYPDHQLAFIMYSPRIPAAVGERFMQAYLRGARDYQEAFFRDVGRADVVQVLASNMGLPDASIFGRIAYASIDPNGALNEASMAQDIDWWVRQRLLDERVDLANVVERRYAEQAVAALGRW